MRADAPIACFGGTFDPVHYGHLRLAVETLERLPIAEIHFIPLYAPNHRHPPVAPAGLRQRMLTAALGTDAKLKLDERELNRGGISYTVDTLRSLRSEHGQRPIIWIMGMDSFASLPQWHRWEELPELAHLFVASRPGAGAPQTGPLCELIAKRGVDDPDLLAAASAGKLLIAQMPMLEISASAIRESIAHGRSPRYLVPDSVISIIDAHGLYRLPAP